MAWRRILSDAQLEKMVELRESGWSVARIAAWFTAQGTSVSAGSIGWQCLRLGAYSPRCSAAAKVKLGARARPFTPDEDERLLALEATGVSVTEIARQLGRKRNSTMGRLYTLAKRDALAEAQ